MDLLAVSFSQKSIFFLLLLMAIGLATACQPQPKQVSIEADGTTKRITTEVTTVRDALDEAKIELGPLDRVNPDLYTELKPGMTIKVVRVTEKIERERAVLSFERQTVVNEALPKGESRLAQLGVNGEEEISTRIVFEDGQEVNRTEISREVTVLPVPEILIVGPQDSLPSVPVAGTMAYMANNNAWLVRSSSGSRRALTTDGNLDGRVFSLSPDGRQLLYTTALTNEIDLPLNELWLASTTIVGEKPITVGVQGVLQAEWSPVLTDSRLIYSTAERTANPPGWRANNDLWLLTPPNPTERRNQRDESLPEPEAILPANTQGLYPWWGTTFAWSPDGAKLAYARADQIGVIDIEAAGEATVTPLLDFPPLETFSDWVWVPGISWSPDGQFIAATIHGPPVASEPAEESQVFDLWLLNIDGAISAKIADRVGMWANPAWSEAGLAFGEALTPLQSVNSRYRIVLVDRDGSNRHQLFPFSEEVGVQLPELVWSPDQEELLFTYNGNLYTVNRQGGLPKQITTDGQTSHPRWALDQPVVLTGTVSITGTQSLTASQSITGSVEITPTGTFTTTPTIITTPTRTLTPTTSPTATSSPTSGAATRTPTPSPTQTRTPTPTRPGSTRTATITPSASPPSSATPELITPTLTITPSSG
ncbi:MAG: G5 domain-containing protein [Anaerolineae bacterium]|nr:G5 domain-containing protein [Anaerolineae bacterium]